MRLTTLGWATVAGAAAMAVAGRTFGLTEWYVAAGAVSTIVIVSAMWLGVQVLDLDVRRVVHPPRVPAGGSCRVEVSVHSGRRRRSPVAVLTDTVDGALRARLYVSPVNQSSPAVTQYRIPTTRRGLLRFGPLRIEASDPFGIWLRRVAVERYAEVVVLPEVVPLEALPPASGEEPDVGRRNVRMLQTATDEVSALRDFRPGDDVRRVHWPTTAKVGSPVVRQYDEPWQRRVTVLLDTSTHRTDGPSFERAVSAAASIVVSGTAANQMVRLLTPGGVDTGFLSADVEVDMVLDLLATLQPDESDGLLGVHRRLSREHHGGTFVTIWGTPDANAIGQLRTMEVQFGSALRVVCGRLSGDMTADRPIVVHDGGRPLAEAWHAAMVELSTVGTVAP